MRINLFGFRIPVWAVLSPIALAAGLFILPDLAGAEAPDRSPTMAERAAIERVLRANHFVGWEEIELDDGNWEVDDARVADGKAYDVKLAPKTLRIVRRVLER